jgi:hypothetical protein
MRHVEETSTVCISVRLNYSIYFTIEGRLQIRAEERISQTGRQDITTYTRSNAKDIAK